MALQKIKCATRADVAREANVSETIVSYVMNNNRYVAAEKRKRVLEAAEKLNYSPNNMALALSGKDSKQLLFIVDTPESERLGSMLGSLDKYAYEKGSVVTLCACRNDESFVSRILSRRFDGIVISSKKILEKFVRRFVQAGIPTVLLLTRNYRIKTGVGKIGTGLRSGAEGCVKYFYEMGRRNIIYLDRVSQENIFSDLSDSRLQGFAAQMEAMGFDWKDNVITGCRTDEEVEQKIAEYLKTKKVDAILGRNDRMACIGMRAVKKLGYSIPKDIVIMGFDDTSVCNYVTPSLSSVHLDNEAIAKKAIEMIYLMREGHQIKETVHFKYKIIERESTGK